MEIDINKLNELLTVRIMGRRLGKSVPNYIKKGDLLKSLTDKLSDEYNVVVQFSNPGLWASCTLVSRYNPRIIFTGIDPDFRIAIAMAALDSVGVSRISYMVLPEGG